MEEYQPLNWEISVPKEWPTAAGPMVIEKLLRKAVDNYLLGQRSVITMEGVSALAVDEGSGLFFVRMEERSYNKTWRVDILFPVKASIVKVEDGRPRSTRREPVYDLPIKLSLDHLFSDWFESRSDRFRVVTAAPVFEKILESKGITGEEVYNYALKTTYRTHKNLLPRKMFAQPGPKEHSFALVKKISDDQWEMECYDCLSPPRQSRRNRGVAHSWIVSFRNFNDATYHRCRIINH